MGTWSTAFLVVSTKCPFFIMKEKKYTSTDKNQIIDRYPQKTAILYVRVSSYQQIGNFSIRTQLKTCRDFAHREKIKIVGEFIEEGESAKDAERTELKNLLNFISRNKGKVDYVIVYKFDRWTRSNASFYSLKSILIRNYTNLISATEKTDDSPTGRFLEGIFALVAQFDNEIKAQRTRDCMTTKALDGWFPHQPPYGYRNNKETKRVEKDHIYFEPMKAIAYKFIANSELNDLANYLNDLGLKTRGGIKRNPRPFTSKDIGGILMRYSKFWAGVYDWGTEKNINGKYPKMISWEDHLLIQERFRNKEASIGNPKQEFILNFAIRYKEGFLSCSECGKRMKSCKTEGNGGRYYFYYCNNPDCSTKKKSIQKHILEQLFENLLGKITPNKRYIELFKEITVTSWNNQQQEIKEKQVKANNYKEGLLNEKKETISMRRRGELELEDFNNEMERIKNDLIVTEKVIEENKIDKNELDSLLEQADLFLSNIKPLYLGFNTKHKREFIKIIFPNGIKYADGVLQTDKKSCLFEYLETLQKGEIKDVTPRGIEPRLSG